VDFTEFFFGVPTRLVDDSPNPVAMAIGGLTVLCWFALGVAYYLWKRRSEIITKLGPLRYSIVAFLFLTMMALPIKIILRIAFNIKYILVTPWFNI
jgi:hypothetical protein